MRLLATKKLSISLKEKLIQNEFSLIEHPFIQIKSLPVKIKAIQKNLIFTSQNAIEIAFSNPKIIPFLGGKKCFCVGKKSKSILEENGQKVVKTAQNSSELALYLTKKYKNEAFSFFVESGEDQKLKLFFL
jgi:uroporphyrinogen-III synthase